MTWTFEQVSGKLYGPEGDLIAIGYAGGNCGENPEGVNNPDLQQMSQVGPLPCGKYKRGEVIEGSHLGPFAIRLIPDPENKMFGRSGFFMHGDNSKGDRSASEGCIIMSRQVRNQFHDSIDDEITVGAHT